MYFILEGHKAIPEPDLMEWARWYENADRVVAKTQVGNAEVSTVFLGLDHNFGAGPPLLFETMIFEGPLDGEQWRYPTWDQAEAGHRAAVFLAKARIATPPPSDDAKTG